MKKMVLLSMILLMSIVLLGCNHIEDTNGNDPNLETLTLDNITATSISMVGSGASIETKRFNFTILTMYTDIDLDYLKMVGGKYSGVKNLLAFELKESKEIELTVSSNITFGNLGLVLINQKREIIHVFAVNQSETFRFTANETQIFFIRMGAESFGGTIEIKRSFK